MKIGILTQRLHLNYGGLLQNYALQTILRRTGHEVYTLDWSKKRHDIKWYVKVIGLYLAHIFMPKWYKRPELGYTPSKKEQAVINQHIKHFISDQISRTDLIKTSHGFKEVSRRIGLEAFIVGSDQCWRPSYNRFLPEMFLSFVKKRIDIKRIAYAASFGTDKWEYNKKMTDLCRKLARQFDVITVREDSAVDLCTTKFGVNAYHVLDPTMLLTKEDYETLVSFYKEPCSKGNLYYYFLDPSDDKYNLIQTIESKTKLTAFSVIPKYNSDHLTKACVKLDMENCIYPSVTKWLRAFMDAEMVLVDSFHGMVFSIIFNKPFWVIGNEDRGLARFKSLLKVFNLEHRLLTSDSFNKTDVNQPIEWNEVNCILNSWRTKSLNLLLSQLS